MEPSRRSGFRVQVTVRMRVIQAVEQERLFLHDDDRSLVAELQLAQQDEDRAAVASPEFQDGVLESVDLG